MNASPTSAQSRRYRIGLIFLLVLGLPTIAVCLFFGCAFIALDIATVDADIPPDIALLRLADLLRQSYNVKLDPEDRVIVAHEIRTALNGDGEVWYLVRLDPAHASRFEADFLASARSSPMPLEKSPIEAGPFQREGLRPQGWKSGPPPGVRAWSLDGRPGDCAVFFDNTFYLYTSHS